MATCRSLFTSATLFRNVFVPLRSTIAVRGGLNSLWHGSAYDDFSRSINEDRYPDSYRRRDGDFFSDMFDPATNVRSHKRMPTAKDGWENSGVRKGWYAYENIESLRLRFDMPGLDRQHVKVTVQHDLLSIKGELEEEGEPPRRYCGCIELPAHIYKVDEVEADMKNGVLKIRVPKVTMEERKDVHNVEVK